MQLHENISRYSRNKRLKDMGTNSKESQSHFPSFRNVNDLGKDMEILIGTEVKMRQQSSTSARSCPETASFTSVSCFLCF
jgi:hypothetical protein